MTSRRKFMFIVAMVLGLSARSAFASSIVFTNFGPGYAYDMNNGVVVQASNWVQGNRVEFASAFTPTDTYGLDMVLLALGNWDGPALAEVSIASDDGNGHPGTVLESWLVPVPTQFGQPGAPVSATSLLSPILTSGSQYWIVLGVPDLSATAVVWGQNSLGTYNNTQLQVSEGAWMGHTYSPAFEVQGTLNDAAAPVPEPASLTLLGGGLVMVARRLRNRRRG